MFVDREYNVEEEIERKLLCPILKAARKHTHYRGKCKLDGTKLVIRGKTYHRGNLENLPEDISAISMSSKESNDAIGFFGELNPLSNFHSCSFSYNGFVYNSSEQLIQHQKARLFGDVPSAEKIMNPKTALDCKCISKDIVNYDHEKWKTEAKSRCEEGIKAKFMQNSGLRLYLLNTGEKRIIESCSDKLWGTGIQLHDKNCLNPSYWNSQGILGEILKNIRTSIHDIIGTNIIPSPKLPQTASSPSAITTHMETNSNIADK